MHVLQQQQQHSSWRLQQQQQLQPVQLPSRPRQAGRRLLRVAAANDGGSSKNDDRANPNKADFSAYWSLKFREFFSKRRQYLELARKRQEPPEIFKKIDEQIRVQEEKLEAARMQARWVRLHQSPLDPSQPCTNLGRAWLPPMMIHTQ